MRHLKCLCYLSLAEALYVMPPKLCRTTKQSLIFQTLDAAMCVAATGYRFHDDFIINEAGITRVLPSAADQLLEELIVKKSSSLSMTNAGGSHV